MPHRILFDNAYCDWNEALPLGNGVFGGMAHYCDGLYHISMNHYEVYYTHLHQYSHAWREERTRPPRDRSDEYRQMVADARRNTEPSGLEPDFTHYRSTIMPEEDIPRQAPEYSGESHPPTGEMRFSFGGGVAAPEDFSLCLDIEEATVSLRLTGEGCELTAHTKMLADCDGLVTLFRQSRPGLLDTITLSYPQRRNHEGFSYCFTPVDPHTVLFMASFYPQGEDRGQYPPFRFAVVYRVAGASFTCSRSDTGAVLSLREADNEVVLVAHVLTDLCGAPDLGAAACAGAQDIAKHLEAHLAAHKAHWQAFFGRSSVYLSDPVVEKLWYLNLYVLGCCSGGGGRRKEQASGLNGLWDIRQPTMWGSLWYWDVNIQVSYWPVYAANHLELAQAFNDGFLSFADEARRRAEGFYKMHGYAIDYPHPFYNCIGPWCAQHLWWYYEYSGDEVFLREKAYPLFLDQIRFIEDIVQYDDTRDCFVFFPDISPEQGPITRNSTITLASVKYLLRIALQANRILGEAEEDAARFRRLLEKMPPYPTAVMERYGWVLKDSEPAPVGLALRHPSLLMPIYPASELAEGSEEARRLAENTVFFASENTEYGVFPFGWISAAAARLGHGNMALRILYEQGLDLILRANGMGAEETDRWVNHCVVDSGHLYHPFMMECVGEIINCVNEMLLHSHEGVIRVFPALPDGTREQRPLVGKMRPPLSPWGEKPPANWTSCGFDGLLARGGFEVSARMEEGTVCWISLHSPRGGEAVLALPASLREQPILCGGQVVETARRSGETVVFMTQAGRSYEIGRTIEPLSRAGDGDVNMYTTHTGHRNFIGKHRNTDAFKLLDACLYDGYVDNERHHPRIVCRFSFGVEPAALAKPPGISPGVAAPRHQTDLQFIKVTPTTQYTPCRGYGFADPRGMIATDTMQTDYLLRDFVQGVREARFGVELPKGRYEVLVLSGGRQATSHVTVGAVSYTMTTASREYNAELFPVVHKRDGLLTVAVRPDTHLPWNLNAVVVRKIAAYT